MLIRVPNVSPAADILESGLKRASRISPTKGLKEPTMRERNRSTKQLDALTTNLCKPLGQGLTLVPKSAQLELHLPLSAQPTLTLSPI